uniref:NADH dehydrogenase [ubiquinone] 1 beta subcomplex subunit 7 n=1 Tax=Cacopsylla melanoneura TaxID=428564 RepID=A0A8D8M4B1_9HEMI
MGGVVSHQYNLYFNQDVTPFPLDGIKHDPLFGFEDRPVKVMKATEEEMASCKLPQYKRDYCAHKLINYKKCYADNIPWVQNCEHEVHEYNDCLYAELVDTYKDYERERRLLVRAQRIAAKKAKENIEE